MANNNGFNDKVMQIGAQLGYFDFTSDMNGMTLGELFKEQSIKEISVSDALKSLNDMRGVGKYNSYDLEEYIPPIIERVQNIGGSAAAPENNRF